MNVVHSGFDGLKFTVQADIPPEFRILLADAKAQAVKTNSDCIFNIGEMQLAVRRTGGSAFSAHTGEYGAEWYFLDPENRPPNNPGITVDFRAFLLATGGLEAAQEHFESCMAAFGIRYVETQLRVSRVDFAIDILAPWFEPNREALVVPPGTRIIEFTGFDETETHSTGARVTGLRAGAVANRKLAIYDKRAEVISKGKMGWLKIWNASLKKAGKIPLDLKNRDLIRCRRATGVVFLRETSRSREPDYRLSIPTGSKVQTFSIEAIRFCWPGMVFRSIHYARLEYPDAEPLKL